MGINQRQKGNLGMRKAVSLMSALAFLFGTLAPALATPTQTPLAAETSDFRLPSPGTMVPLSRPFAPPVFKGIKIHADNPFRLDFILDKGDSQSGEGALKDESSRLIKYFLAALTVPENDLWVNLSPYEKDRIIPNSFGLTEMGRDLLAEDYMLKQITASLIYPEGPTGKVFWQRIYTEAAKRFGTTNIPVNTFNKVWIVPEKAVVYENAKAGTAYVIESQLKVMLEQDYLALEKNQMPTRGLVQKNLSSSTLPSELALNVKASQVNPRKPNDNTNELGSQILRQIIIPQLTKEVNENANFAQLRQVYNALILAEWYKHKIKDSILAQVYEDGNKITGNPPSDVEAIYQRYIQAFKKGAFNYIKEDTDPLTQERVPKKYFSGGVAFDKIQVSKEMPSDQAMRAIEEAAGKTVAVALELLAGGESVSADQSSQDERQRIAFPGRDNVIVEGSPQETYAKAAELIIKELNEAARRTAGEITMVLATGTTWREVYKELGKRAGQIKAIKRLHLYASEHYAGSDPGYLSTGTEVTDDLFANFPKGVPHPAFHQWDAQEVTAYFAEHPADVVLLGIRENGGMAGLDPGNPLLSPLIGVGSMDPDKIKMLPLVGEGAAGDRVLQTIAPRIILEAGAVIAVATGSGPGVGKVNAISRIIEGNGSVNTTPMLVVFKRPDHGKNVRVIVDSTAYNNDERAILGPDGQPVYYDRLLSSANPKADSVIFVTGYQGMRTGGQVVKRIPSGEAAYLEFHRHQIPDGYKGDLIDYNARKLIYLIKAEIAEGHEGIILQTHSMGAVIAMRALILLAQDKDVKTFNAIKRMVLVNPWFGGYYVTEPVLQYMPLHWAWNAGFGFVRGLGEAVGMPPSFFEPLEWTQTSLSSELIHGAVSASLGLVPGMVALTTRIIQASIGQEEGVLGKVRYKEIEREQSKWVEELRAGMAVGPKYEIMARKALDQLEQLSQHSGEKHKVAITMILHQRDPVVSYPLALKTARTIGAAVVVDPNENVEGVEAHYTILFNPSLVVGALGLSQETARSDKATIASGKNGGIDLTPQQMNLQIQNTGASINFHIDPAMLRQLQDATSFVPVIIRIQPITDLALFLGITPA